MAIILLLIGYSTGIWMLVSRSWRRHPRPRLDLAFAYLVVGWVSSLVIFHDTPGMALCITVALSILAAYLLLRVLPALRRPTADEDLFP